MSCNYAKFSLTAGEYNCSALRRKCLFEKPDQERCAEIYRNSPMHKKVCEMRVSIDLEKLLNICVRHGVAPDVIEKMIQDIENEMVVKGERTKECVELFKEVRKTSKAAEFKRAVKPLEEFVNKYCCPHDTITVTQGHAEILSGEMVITLKTPD